MILLDAEGGNLVYMRVMELPAPDALGRRMSLFAQVPTVGYRWKEAASGRNGRKPAPYRRGCGKAKIVLGCPGRSRTFTAKTSIWEDYHV